MVRCDCFLILFAFRRSAWFFEDFVFMRILWGMCSLLRLLYVMRAGCGYVFKGVRSALSFPIGVLSCRGMCLSWRTKWRDDFVADCFVWPCGKDERRMVSCGWLGAHWSGWLLLLDHSLIDPQKKVSR